MKNPLTLLVVEDRIDHLVDFNKMLGSVHSKLPIQLNVFYAADLESALLLLPQADVVISDVFFPLSPGMQEDSNGQAVVHRCLELQKPVVWVTSTYHHGAKTNNVSEWGRARGLEMFDCYDRNNLNGESPHKPWKEALYGVLFLAIGLEDGTFLIENGIIMGRVDKFGERKELRSALQCILNNFFSSEPDDSFSVKMAEMGFGRP